MREGMEVSGGQNDVARSLGRLEGEVRTLVSRFDSLEARFNSLETRLDKVIFAMFGFGAALIAGMVGVLVKLFV